MHEFSIVEAMIEKVVDTLPNAKQGSVRALHFRRGSTFSESSLRLAFELVSKGTVLENAELIVDTVNHEYHCTCGYQQIVTSDDLMGHMFVCPQCGVISEIDEAHDLMLLNVILREPATEAQL